jgi:hypothetical protein
MLTKRRTPSRKTALARSRDNADCFIVSFAQQSMASTIFAEFLIVLLSGMLHV